MTYWTCDCSDDDDSIVPFTRILTIGSNVGLEDTDPCNTSFYWNWCRPQQCICQWPQEFILCRPLSYQRKARTVVLSSLAFANEETIGSLKEQNDRQDHLLEARKTTVLCWLEHTNLIIHRSPVKIYPGSKVRSSCVAPEDDPADHPVPSMIQHLFLFVVVVDDVVRTTKYFVVVHAHDV